MVDKQISDYLEVSLKDIYTGGYIDQQSFNME